MRADHKYVYYSMLCVCVLFVSVMSSVHVQPHTTIISFLSRYEMSRQYFALSITIAICAHQRHVGHTHTQLTSTYAQSREYIESCK